MDDVRASNQIQFSKVRSNSRLADEIVNQIKAAIFEKKLAPGDRLPSEQALADQFGTSRTTAREALRSMELSGLIAVKAGQGGGSFVIEPDISRVQAMFCDLVRANFLKIEHFTKVRMLLEPNLVEMIMANIGAKEIALLEENVAEADAELLKPKPRSAYINIKFHKILIDCTENPLIIVLFDTLFELLRTYLRTVKPQKAIAERVVLAHKEILKRIKEGDVERVRRAVIDHVAAINETLL